MPELSFATATANDSNVPFAYDQALAAARNLWTLANDVRHQCGGRQSDRLEAADQWAGPKRDEFEQKMATEAVSAEQVAVSLEDTARALARAWSQARGQQDRINFARWAEAEQRRDEADRNVFESIGNSVAEVFGHGFDPGPTPQDPPVPDAPWFAVTRPPVHPEHEHAGGVCRVPA